jgi:hypothetical protein
MTLETNKRRGIAAFVAIALLSGLTALAVPPPTGTAPVLIPVGGFGIDGNLVADSSGGDWLGGTNAAAGVLDPAGVPLNPATTFHFVDPFNSSSDNVFVGGLKWTDDPNTWQWTTSKSSSKTDINNVLLHIARDADGHTWSVVAADRYSTSGDSYIDFEFLQNTLVVTNGGKFASSGPNGGRTVNDLLLSLAFTGGGKVADFLAYRWLPNGAGGYAYVDVTAQLPLGRVFVALNSNSVAVAFGAFGATTYAPNAFAEAAIDMTALLGGFDPCLSVGFKTIMVKTKSSPSSTATIGDFINPIQYSLRIGPSADAGGNQAQCSQGDSTVFVLQGKASPGLAPISSTTWSVVNGSAIIDAPSSLVTTAYVSSATATLRLTVTQTNGCAETNDAVLTVVNPPTNAITGSATLCPNSTNVFQGPAGMDGYSWSISGNGTISGPSNTATVKVVAGSACGATFTLNLAVTKGICSSAASMDVLAVDTTAPTITAPADRVLDCPANTSTNATGFATAQDDCGQVQVSYSDSVTNNCGGTKVIARTWIATDHCGNSASAVQMITVRDITPPTLTVPPSLTLDCPANTTPSNTGVATATDGCSAATVTFSDSVSNNCGGSSIIKRLWTATDACGNSISGMQTITVRDISAPSLIIPPNVTLECPADTSTNNTGIATSVDSCSATTVTYSDVVSNSCGGSEVIQRTWTARDQCGNVTNRTQLITVRDTTKPSLILPPNITLECPTSPSTNNAGVAVAQDTCSSVTLSFSDAVTTNCAGTKVIARTWTAVDSCGNSTNGIQTITVRDSMPPTLTIPPNMTLECPANTSTNNTGSATAVDGCSSAIVTFNDVTVTNCGGTKVVQRTWTARDLCGNVTNAIQTITVRDSTPPTLTLPPNVTLECPANTNTLNTGVATAQDGCGNVTVTFSDVVSNSCGGSKLISRIWTATDSCGNSTNRTQLITVQDTTPPVVVAPANLTLDCPATTTTNVTGVATVTDGCSATTLSFSDSVSNNCGGTKIISRTWRASDGCGNVATAVQTITVRDITAPSLVIPANLTLECPADTSTNNTGIATAVDGCSATTLTYSDVVTNTCGGTEVIHRTWTARDQCGNVTNGVQIITVRDTTRPSLILPPNITLECPAITTTNNTGVAIAQDTCGSVSLSFSDVVTTNCAGTKVIARTWTAVDSCGNSTNGIQTITVRDSLPPQLVIPPNVTLECPANTSTNNTGIATAVDGCSTATVSFNDVTVTNCGGTKVVQRTWTARDLCGNVTNAIQTITVRDSTPPTLTLPANLTMECPANTNILNTGVATAQDGCGSVTVTFSDVVSNICGGSKLISRIWRATDACGNTTNGTQLITVQDTTPPTIVAPPNLTLECPAPTTTNATGMPMVTDGCSATTVSYSDSVSNNCGGTKIISRTWRATDGCGNVATAFQTITVIDTTPPSLTLPADIVLQCPGDTRTNVTGVARAVDGCGSVTLTYSDVISNGCALTRTIWRQWTAIDQCGHSTNGVQMISVIDTNKPAITCPALSVQCAGDVPPAYASLSDFIAAGGTASDSCSSSLTFSLVSDSGLVGSCPGTVTRVYRVTDACGNSSDGTQRITVKDTIPPVLTVPTNLIVECGSSLDPSVIGSATATDNCDTNVALTYSDNTLESQYSLSFLVADPDTGTGPYGPTYLEFAPSNLPCPDSAIQTGRALDPLRNAVAYSTNGQLDALTSIGNVPLAFGQIVPFEVVIQASGGVGPERGTIEFTADWSTYTTSNNRFGYDTNYMVYCAFVDAADPGLIDPNYNARVESYSSTVVNQGTIAEAIRGTFRVSGIDPGDRIIVEIWVVLDSTMPDHTGGTVSSKLVSAQTAAVPAVPISIGMQTDSLGNLSKIGALPPPQTQPPLGALPPQPPALPGATVSIFDRTWTATDDCGNQSTGVQRITVRDTTPPTIIAPDVVLECPATDTSTNVTGVAVAQDNCGSVTLTYSDVITNGIPGTQLLQTILRTWTATDQAGLSTNVVQTIKVMDTTPPTLTVVPATQVVTVGGTWSFGQPQASDTCGSVTVSVLNTVTNFTATNTMVVSRTWLATDSAGNTNTCCQTMVIDLGPAPTIVTQPHDQTFGYGDNGALSVVATCTTPLTYQWRLGGINIAGATSSSVQFTAITFSNAGSYTVVVSSPGGSVTSSVAVVTVQPRLIAVRNGGTLILTWPAPFILQSATSVNGPYRDVHGAVSPYSVPMTAPQQFFRLRSGPPSLDLKVSGGISTVTLTGTQGENYILQASSDLVHWTNLHTNTLPMVYMDSAVSQNPIRFYRAVLAH